MCDKKGCQNPDGMFPNSRWYQLSTEGVPEEIDHPTPHALPDPEPSSDIEAE